jgi:hypothetical protein
LAFSPLHRYSEKHPLEGIFNLVSVKQHNICGMAGMAWVTVKFFFGGVQKRL